MNSTTTLSTTYRPTSAAQVQALVTTLPKLIPHGALTKPPLSWVESGQEVAHLDMSHLAGILEYDPGEYTFTAYAGTRLAEIAAALAEHGQYMPFDPPLVEAGATLGGTIAAGISGSGRYRYGGLRDFILGVHFVDGHGRLVRGGGKVVKNAAGFDLPKLMVGSLGRLGVLISASFKVFPAPPTTATLVAHLPSLDEALAAMARLMGGPYDLEALDLVPAPDGSAMLLVRIGGPGDVLAARLDRLRKVVGSGESLLDDKSLWAEANAFSWVKADDLLVKAPTTAQTLPALEQALQATTAARRYAAGGNVAWVSWPDSFESCHRLLSQLGMRGLVLRGLSQHALAGMPLQPSFLHRVRTALDPAHRFLDFE